MSGLSDFKKLAKLYEDINLAVKEFVYDNMVNNENNESTVQCCTSECEEKVPEYLVKINVNKCEECALQCNVFECQNKVPYDNVLDGINSCTSCTVQCAKCEEKVSSDNICKSDLYFGWCEKCRECKKCREVMWDYVCECEILNYWKKKF